MSDDKLELPIGWAISNIDAIADIVRGITFPSSDKSYERSEGSVVCLRTTNVQDQLEWDDVLYVPRKYVKTTDRWLQEYDCVISLANSYELVGKVALAKNVPVETTFGGFIAAIRSRGVDPRFLFYALREPETKERVRRLASRTVNLANISAKNLNATEIPIPPIPEQRRIVAKIEALQERSGRAAKALEEVGPLLEQFRQSILAAAFSGRLTADWREKNPSVEPAHELLARIRTERRQRWEQAELAKYEAKGKQPPKDWKDKYEEPEPVDETDLPELPEGWCWTTLEAIATHQSGAAFKSDDFAATGIQVIKLGNLYQGRFDRTRDPAFLPADHDDSDAARILDGDILVSQTGTRHKRDYGFFVTVPEGSEPLLLNQRVLAIRSIDKSLGDWIVYASQLDHYRDHFFAHETGGVNQGNVGIAGIMQGPIPMAPIQEIAEICSLVKRAVELATAIQAGCHDSQSALTQLNQSILAKAFRGELVPQDPNDEPASELLARIRMEREVSGDRVQGSGRKKKAAGKGDASESESARPAKRSKRSSTAASATTPDASADASPEPARPQRRSRRSSSNNEDASLVIRVLAEGGAVNIHADTSGPQVLFYTKSSGGGLMAEIEDIPEADLKPNESARAANLADLMESEMALLYPEHIHPTYLPQLRAWYTSAVRQLPSHFDEDFLQDAKTRWSEALQIEESSTPSGSSRRRNSGRLFDA